MKKSHKKADWYKQRCDEIFKLMKWENHKDHVGFDFSKENINLDDISKLQGNCKMSVMDELENIGGAILKSSKREVRQIQKFVESRLPVKIIGAEMGSKHIKLTIRNNKTDTTRLVFVSATPKKTGRYNLVVRDIRRTFREVGEDL